MTILPKPLLDPRNDLVSELQLNLVELAKLDRLIRSGADSVAVGQGPSGANYAALVAWVTYFQHWQEESIMNHVDYEPVRQAMAQLQALSADDEARYLAERRELALLAERTEIAAAEERGEQRGQYMALQRMIESGIPEAKARAILHL